MNKSGLLFDLDGTVLDTAPDFAHCLNQMLKECNQSPINFQKIRQTVSQGAIGLLRLGFEIEPNHPEFESKRSRFLDLYEEVLGTNTTFFPGMKTLLIHLNDQDIPWGIVTNKPKRFTGPLLKKLDFYDQVPFFVSGDTLSKSKPSPDPLKLAVSKLELSPENSLYVGDDLRDVQAAHAANMQSCIAHYGYIRDDEDPQTWGAHYYVKSVPDILTIFRSLNL